MNLKYMKVSLFEISYKDKLPFSPYFFLDVPAYPTNYINPYNNVYLHYSAQLFLSKIW